MPWDVREFTCAGYSGPVLSIAWCGVNEHQLVGGDATGEMRLWDMRRSGTVHTFDQHDAEDLAAGADSDADSGGDDGRCVQHVRMSAFQVLFALSARACSVSVFVFGCSSRWCRVVRIDQLPAPALSAPPGR